MGGAAVPLAAVNEDGDLRAGEDQIGASAVHTDLEAVAQAVGPERTTQPQLRAGIPAADSGHVL